MRAGEVVGAGAGRRRIITVATCALSAAVAGEAVRTVGVAACTWGHQILEIDERGGGEELRAGDGGDELCITRPAGGDSGAGVEEQHFINVAHEITVPVVFFGVLTRVVMQPDFRKGLAGDRWVHRNIDTGQWVEPCGGFFKIEDEIIEYL